MVDSALWLVPRKAPATMGSNTRAKVTRVTKAMAIKRRRFGFGRRHCPSRYAKMAGA